MSKKWNWYRFNIMLIKAIISVHFDVHGLQFIKRQNGIIKKNVFSKETKNIYFPKQKCWLHMAINCTVQCMHSVLEPGRFHNLLKKAITTLAFAPIPTGLFPSTQLPNKMFGCSTFKNYLLWLTLLVGCVSNCWTTIKRAVFSWLGKPCTQSCS